MGIAGCNNKGVPEFASHRTDSNWYIISADGLTDTLLTGHEVLALAPSLEDSVAGKAVYRSEGVAVDTVYLTSKAIRLMGRINFDFKPLFGLEGAMSERDFKLYFEAILMGVENQPVFYEDRSQRFAWMAGFHFPTFGLLDVLAIEAEYWPNLCQRARK